MVAIQPRLARQVPRMAQVPQHGRQTEGLDAQKGGWDMRREPCVPYQIPSMDAHVKDETVGPFSAKLHLAEFSAKLKVYLALTVAYRSKRSWPNGREEEELLRWLARANS